ncbi:MULTISPECIES: cysteine--tRNA ligase [unclassified Streptococcus]|uniref:cysteine--tRNA ligase n=1 Tax=unclassified Streptococcus TaxID=2608887 RepID=UPI001072AA49|nr:MULTISPECIES: cysteine--tRNA ligase [unclassified Streptococcus]MBF0806361.1 cysteine--tRNA ligase [Streptococcus sp. 19428wA2_WM07]TFU28017.1 cysteine--tRNA ligase [Streptococcus sp. WM07]
MIRIYNTLSRQLEEFRPQVEGQVSMYVCGPTVYNYIHIGNARPVVAFDTIRRYLTYSGYEVTYISNFTDVDDKIINRALEEGISPEEVADKYIAAYLEDTQALGILPATQNPRVMDYIPEIITFIQDLLAKEMAYESQGDVYFRVRKSDGYGRLANKSLEDLAQGASGRLGSESERKEDPLDFALWKSAKTGEISWDSPWGAGRPGWHIECSVMSTELLGPTLDIHGGGSDLEFPHHTNEIAQSEAKTGQTFVNYWMHNAFITIDDEKMSKSLGNFRTVHELLQTIDGQVLRLFLNSQHYRRPINFSDKALYDAEVNLKYLKHTFLSPLKEEVDTSRLPDFVQAFEAAMDDDFNTANALTVLFDLAKWINSGHYTKEVRAVFEEFLTIFGLVFQEDILEEEIEKLIAQRQEARAAKNFQEADRIREMLAQQGIRLLDTKEGVRWQRD